MLLCGTVLVAALAPVPSVPHVLVADALSPDAIGLLTEGGARVTESHPSAAELEDGLLARFDAVAVRSATRLTETALRAGSEGRLRVVGRAGVGVDNIDVAAAKATGSLWVLNTPAASTQSVVELTIAHLLASVRALPAADLGLREGRWLKGELPGSELAGKRLGLLGFGRIARGVVPVARALGMEVHATSPRADADAAAALGVTLQPDAAALFAACTHVSLHCGLTAETRGLVNAELIGRMPSVGADGARCGAHLVNVARGGVVVEADAAAALKSGALATYAADVFDEEPLPRDSPLLATDGFVGTPHVGASTSEASARVGTQLAAAMLDALGGRRPPEGVVCAPQAQHDSI